MENLDTLGSNASNGQIVAAYMRQARVQSDFTALKASHMSYTQPPSAGPPGSGAMYRFSNGISFVDRNGDSLMDEELYIDKSGTVFVNYGTGVNTGYGPGWQVYNPSDVLPAPPRPGTTSGPPGSGYD